MRLFAIAGTNLLHRLLTPKLLKIMKLTATFLLIICLQVSAKTNGQMVSLSFKNAPMKQVFREIQKQTSLNVLVDEFLLEKMGRVTIKVNNVPVDEALDACLQKKSLTYSIEAGAIIIKAKETNVQQLTLIDIPSFIIVKGKITDDSGKPLAGASVKVKGSEKGVSSDANGNFELQLADKGGVLEVTYIGYEAKNITISKSTNDIIITLKKTEIKVDEVVVVGYGLRKKRDLTGSVARVTNEELTKGGLATIDQALQGKVAGVMITSADATPGGAIDVRIRGIGSLGNNEPLYVIDGAPTKSGISFINPNDIETIDILKDASAASIYGVEGRNGVVIITTKKGKDGKAKMTFDSYISVSNPYKKISVLGPRDYAAINLERWEGIGLDSVDINRSLLNPAALPKEGTNWQDALFQNAITQDHTVGLSGGNKQTTYSTSFGFRDQNGIVKTTGFKRFTYRGNFNHNISDNFSVGGSFSYSYTHQRSQDLNKNQSAFYYAIKKSPTVPVYNPDGSYGTEPIRPDDVRPDRTWGNFPNPLEILNNNDRNKYDNGLYGNVYSEIKPLKDLKFKTLFGFSKYSGNTKDFSIDLGSGIGARPPFYGSLFQVEYTNLQWNWDNYLTYNKIFGKHNIEALVGSSVLSRDLEGYYTSQNQFSITVPGVRYYGFGNVATSNGGSFANKFALTGYFGRINYIFNDKYYLTGNIRRDGSSAFAKENRFGNFPSAAIAWRISKEKFLQNNKFINDLKVRGSWGLTGDPGYPDVASTLLGTGPRYGYSFGGSLVTGYAVNSLGNPKLVWEKTEQKDIGIDLSLLNNKLQITFDWYKRENSNMHILATESAFLGSATPPVQNLGGMTNKGLEFSASYRNKIGPVNYSISGNGSTLKNIVTSLGPKTSLIPNTTKYDLSVQNSSGVTRVIVGQPISVFYGYTAIGVVQTQAEAASYLPNTDVADLPEPGDVKIKDINGDGKITSEDRSVIGSSLPKFIYGFTLNLDYKNFDFSAFIQGVSGNKIYNGFFNTLLEGNGNYSNFPSQILNRWHGVGSSNKIPAIGAASKQVTLVSTLYLEDGSYARLRNMQIGYTFNSPLLRKAAFTKLRIYASVQNLFTLTHYQGMDPEIGTGGGNDGKADEQTKNLQIGLDRGAYPQPRIFTFGINAAF